MPNLAARIDALSRALDLSKGCVSDQLLANGRAVIERANRRLGAGPQTVVALAGATGSGKSSLCNALSGVRLAEQGARRPTTATTLAVSFAATNTALLDLIGVRRRREAAPPIPAMADIVLLDLPDHDSAARAHREEVDQMVAAADQLVWVLDPQKYADAAVHHRYLRNLTKHREVTMVVLNQADRLSPSDLAHCLEHLRELLTADGLPDVTLLATSAVEGRGIYELQQHLGQLAEAKRAAVARLEADLAVVAAQLVDELGEGAVKTATPEALAALNTSLAESAGVPQVVSAVRGAVRHRGTLATGWPMLAWLERLRPDPLRRLRLGPADSSAGQLHRSSLPARSAAAQAQLATGLRNLAHTLSDGMPQPWADAVSQAVQSSAAKLPDLLDRAVVATDVELDREPVWWRLIQALQWVLIASVVVGVVWLIVGGIFGAEAQPVPIWLLVGGVLGGVVLHAGAGAIIGYTARRAAARARRSLERAVAEVASQEVLAPAEAVVERYQQARALAAVGV